MYSIFSDHSKGQGGKVMYSIIWSFQKLSEGHIYIQSHGRFKRSRKGSSIYMMTLSLLDHHSNDRLSLVAKEGWGTPCGDDLVGSIPGVHDILQRHPHRYADTPKGQHSHRLPVWSRLSVKATLENWSWKYDVSLLSGNINTDIS